MIETCITAIQEDSTFLFPTVKLNMDDADSSGSHSLELFPLFLSCVTLRLSTQETIEAVDLPRWPLVPSEREYPLPNSPVFGRTDRAVRMYESSRRGLDILSKMHDTR